MTVCSTDGSNVLIIVQNNKIIKQTTTREYSQPTFLAYLVTKGQCRKTLRLLKYKISQARFHLCCSVDNN